jgi:replicative DNA helicase
MVKCPDALAKHIEQNSGWFEKIFIACVRENYDLFNKVKRVVCIQSGAKKEKHQDDFEETFNNILYAAIRDYNNIFEDKAGSFVPMPVEFLALWLKQKAKSAELLMEQEIDEILNYFNSEIATVKVEAHILHFASLGISSYLKSRRASRIVHQLSLSDVNLDDLALMCEQNVDLISSIEQGSRIISDVPDRVQMQDLPMYEDPNKALVESIDSDIPSLNEALGGGFRKKCAYMIIGGTGSGKTIIACQLACAFTYINGSNGLFISTEQQHDELYRRIVSNRCSIPHKAISKGIFESVLSNREKEVFAEFRKNVAKLNKGSLQFVNWGNFERTSGTKNLVKRLEEEMEFFTQATGKKVDYIILDWIGGALSASAVESGVEIRHVYQEAADAMEEVARKHNLVSVALAQAVVSSANKLQITAEHLSECKTMTRLYTGVIGITALYSEEYAKQLAEEGNKKRKDYRVGSDLDDAISYNVKQYLNISKARHGIQKAIPFKRSYEYQRMDPWT